MNSIRNIWLPRYSPSTGRFDISKAGKVTRDMQDSILIGSLNDYIAFAACPMLKGAGRACDKLAAEMLERDIRADNYDQRLEELERQLPTYLNRSWGAEVLIDDTGAAAFNVARLPEVLAMNSVHIIRGYFSGYVLFEICGTRDEAYAACEQMKRRQAALAESEVVVATDGPENRCPMDCPNGSSMVLLLGAKDAAPAIGSSGRCTAHPRRRGSW